MPGASDEDLAEIYEQAPCGFVSTTPDGAVVRINRTLLDWVGLERADVVGRRRFADLLTAGSRMYHETQVVPLLMLQDAIGEVALDLRGPNRSTVPVFLSSRLKRDAQGAPELVRTTVVDATDRRRYERNLVMARDTERALRDRAQFLQGIALQLAGRLDLGPAVETVVTELGRLTEVVSVEVAYVDPSSGSVRRVATAGADEPDLGGRAATAVPSSASQLLRWDADGHLEASLAEVDGRGGALHLEVVAGLSEDAERRAFVETCVAQCAAGLDRAALISREAETARVLQRAMLTTAPIADERLRTGSAYHPALSSLDVGGDWHDTFVLGRDHIGFAVGDVVGKGLRAASVMGQLRSALRALAMAQPRDPAGVIARLDRFAAQAPDTLMATLVYGVLDLGTGAVDYVCAGHPPPVLVEPGASPRVLEAGLRPLLGLGLDLTVEAGHAQLVAGARLLLYTDGLVERRGEVIDVGIHRVITSLDQSREADPQTLVDTLAAEVVEANAVPDDVCVLCVERRPAPTAP